MKSINCIERVNLWNKGFVELWDFSNANSSQKTREEACAIVCQSNYNKEIKNPKKHFKRLLSENGGRASEVLGFIPYKLNITVDDLLNNASINNYIRFGYLQGSKLLTNFRNVTNLYKDVNCKFEKLECSRNHNNFIVIKVKIPWMIVDHLRRHQLLNQTFSENWQSNRALHKIEYFKNNEVSVEIEENDIAKIYSNTKIRKELINKGEFGLRYTTGWLAGWYDDPCTWQNLINVRSSNGTQEETENLVQVIHNLINKHY